MHDEMVDNSLDVGFDGSALHAVPQSVSQRTIRIQRDYFSRIERPFCIPALAWVMTRWGSTRM
jgi:hypothetical protein